MPNDDSLLAHFDRSKYQTLSKYLPAAPAPRDEASASGLVPMPPVVEQSVISSPQEFAPDLNLLDQLIQQRLVQTDQPVTNEIANSSLSTNINPTFVAARNKEQLPEAYPVNLAAENQSNEEAVDSITSPVEQTDHTDHTEQAIQSLENQIHEEQSSNQEIAEINQEIEAMVEQTSEHGEAQQQQEQQKAVDNLIQQTNLPAGVSPEPVVVIPITQEKAQEAKHKSPKYSLRWLLEWCKKIAKIFSGAVVYKEELAQDKS